MEKKRRIFSLCLLERTGRAGAQTHLAEPHVCCNLASQQPESCSPQRAQSGLHPSQQQLLLFLTFRGFEQEHPLQTWTGSGLQEQAGEITHWESYSWGQGNHQWDCSAPTEEFEQPQEQCALSKSV